MKQAIAVLLSLLQVSVVRTQLPQPIIIIIVTIHALRIDRIQSSCAYITDVGRCSVAIVFTSCCCVIYGCIPDWCVINGTVYVQTQHGSPTVSRHFLDRHFLDHQNLTVYRCLQAWTDTSWTTKIRRVHPTGLYYKEEPRTDGSVSPVMLRNRPKYSRRRKCSLQLLLTWIRPPMKSSLRYANYPAMSITYVGSHSHRSVHVCF